MKTNYFKELRCTCWYKIIIIFKIAWRVCVRTDISDYLVIQFCFPPTNAFIHIIDITGDVNLVLFKTIGKYEIIDLADQLLLWLHWKSCRFPKELYSFQQEAFQCQATSPSFLHVQHGLTFQRLPLVAQQMAARLELLIFALSLWKSNEAEEANISCWIVLNGNVLRLLAQQQCHHQYLQTWEMHRPNKVKDQGSCNM